MAKRKKERRQGVCICYRGGLLSLPDEFWERELAMLKAAGWCPAGTVKPDLFWDGCYTRKEGQTVTAEDARQLAAVARRVWEASPDAEHLGFLLLADVAKRGELRITGGAV